jgi:DNA-binding NarL/FixJ family response regulator
MSSSVLTTEAISVLVVDSNQTQSQLLCGALRRQGTFKVASARAEVSQCFSALDASRADVILLAARSIDHWRQFHDFVRSIHLSCPNVAIVLLLDSYDRELVVNSLRAGTRGLFCLASMPFKSLCRCISSVYRGQYWLNTEQTRYVVEALSINPSLHLINARGQVVLTPREEQTIRLVTDGLNNREIARELNLKENTVKKSLLRIYDKIGVSNRVELVLYALSHWQAHAASAQPSQSPDLETAECASKKSGQSEFQKLA